VLANRIYLGEAVHTPTPVSTLPSSTNAPGTRRTR
jgi:hypothetical protein